MVCHSSFKSSTQKLANIGSFNSRTLGIKTKQNKTNLKILLKASAEGMEQGARGIRKQSRVNWYQLQLLMSREAELQQKPFCRGSQAASRQGQWEGSQRCSEHLQHSDISIEHSSALSLNTKGWWLFQAKACKVLNHLQVFLQEEKLSKSWSFHYKRSQCHYLL